jgi:hypothetical protein
MFGFAVAGVEPLLKRRAGRAARSRPTSYSMVSVYLLTPLGHKICTHEEIPFFIEYLVSQNPETPLTMGFKI